MGAHSKDHHIESTHAEEVDKLRNMAQWMDSKFVIPGTSIRFGFDSLLGFIPGVGDTVTLASTLYLIHKAKQYGLPKSAMVKMMWNLFVDWLIGLVPFIGDIFDIGWKANNKNVQIIADYLELNARSV